MNVQARLALISLLIVIVSGCTMAGRAPEPAERGGSGVPGGSAYRGELLYENHCTGCHTSIAHIRENRRARSAGEVQAWVGRWAGELKLSWTTEEVRDVAQFLVNRYYKFGKSAREGAAMPGES